MFLDLAESIHESLTGHQFDFADSFEKRFLGFQQVLFLGYDEVVALLDLRISFHGHRIDRPEVIKTFTDPGDVLTQFFFIFIRIDYFVGIDRRIQINIEFDGKAFFDRI